VSLRRRFPLLFNSGYATISAASNVLLLVLLTLAGRYLSAADYGRFSYAIALTTIVETLMDSGLGQVTIRAVARERDSADRLFRDILGLKLFWVAVGLLVLVVVTPVLRHDPVVIRLCYIVGISSAVRSYLMTARGLLQGLDRFDLEAAIVVADRVVLLAAGAVALIGGFGLFGLAAAFVAARLATLLGTTVLLGGVVGSLRPRFHMPTWRDLQRAALPLGLFMIAVNLYAYIDTVILGFISTDVEIGWYAAAYRVYEGLTYLPSIMAAVVSPRLSFLFVNDRIAHRRLLWRALGATAAAGAVVGAIGVLAARFVLVLLFGAQYEHGTAALQILAAGAVFVFCTWILHAAAISTNLDRRLFGTTAVGLVVNVGLNLVFIPRWGIAGAAAATVLAEAVTVGLLLAQVARRVGVR